METRIVKIKSYITMESQYGYIRVGDILSLNTGDAYFTKEMESELPESRIITIEKIGSRWTWLESDKDWCITDEMILFYVEDYEKTKFEKLEDDVSSFLDSLENSRNCDYKLFLRTLIDIGCSELQDLTLIEKQIFESLNKIANAKLYIYLNNKEL